MRRSRQSREKGHISLFALGRAPDAQSRSPTRSGMTPAGIALAWACAPGPSCDWRHGLQPRCRILRTPPPTPSPRVCGPVLAIGSAGARLAASLPCRAGTPEAPRLDPVSPTARRLPEPTRRSLRRHRPPDYCAPGIFACTPSPFPARIYARRTPCAVPIAARATGGPTNEATT